MLLTANFTVFCSGHFPVQLPCCHVYGNPCIKKWVRLHGTCPECHRVLCESPEFAKAFGIDICISDDLENMRKFGAFCDFLMDTTDSYPLLAECLGCLNDVINARAHMFVQGCLRPDVANYDEYDRWSAPRATTNQTLLIHESYIVNVRPFGKKIEEIYNFLFIRAVVAERPTIASHPLGTIVLNVILDTVFDMEGMQISAMEIHRCLKSEIQYCLRLWVEGREGRQVQPVPRGCECYVSDVLEAVAMNFMALGTKQMKPGVL